MLSRRAYRWQARSERVPSRGRCKFQIADIGTKPKTDPGANWNDDDVVEGQCRHAQSPYKISRSVDADEPLIDRFGGGKTVNEHHGAGAVAAEIETKRRALPIHPMVAGILGVQDAFTVAKPGDPGAAHLLSQDISVGQAPLTACFLHDFSEPARDRAEEPLSRVDDLVRGILVSALRSRTAGRRSRRRSSLTPD